MGGGGRGRTSSLPSIKKKGRKAYAGGLTIISATFVVLIAECLNE